MKTNTKKIIETWLFHFVFPTVLVAFLILGMSFTINKLQAPKATDPIVVAQKAATEEARTIDPQKIVYDKGVSHLMDNIHKNSFEFLVVSRDFGGYAASVVLFFAQKGEDKIHQLTLPMSTYNNLESTYFLPKKINFEVATEAFLLKNQEALIKSNMYKAKDIDWQREIYVSFGIGMCMAVCWLMLEPLWRRHPDTLPAGQHGGQYVEHSGSKAINPGKIQGGMEDLIGLHDIKAEILQIEDMIKNKEKYKSHGIERPFNILMSGPAGTGKTKMASYLAKSLNVPMYSQPAGALETGLIGGGSQTLNDLYKDANKHPMSIVFLDEGQVLLAKRGQDAMRKNSDDTANTLLSILDGTNVVGQAQVITIVASNFNDGTMEMDSAMLRRFPMKVDFRLPNMEERRDILKFYLEKKTTGCVDWNNTNLNYLADITAGMSPALLNGVTDKASLIAIQEDSIIDTNILFRAFERCSVGLTDRAKTAGREEERRRVAVHELGHFFMQIHPFVKMGLSWKAVKEKARLLKISTEAVAKVGALGYVLSSQDDVSLKTLRQLEEEVMELYGGAAAEEIFYGEENISVGSSNDFEKATRILDTMVNRLSMYGKSKLNYALLKGSETANGLSLMEEKSAHLYTSTLESLSLYRSKIDRLTHVLLENYVMSKDDVFSWLEDDEDVSTVAVLSDL